MEPLLCACVVPLALRLSGSSSWVAAALSSLRALQRAPSEGALPRGSALLLGVLSCTAGAVLLLSLTSASELLAAAAAVGAIELLASCGGSSWPELRLQWGAQLVLLQALVLMAQHWLLALLDPSAAAAAAAAGGGSDHASALFVQALLGGSAVSVLLCLPLLRAAAPAAAAAAEPASQATSCTFWLLLALQILLQYSWLQAALQASPLLHVLQAVQQHCWLVAGWALLLALLLALPPAAALQAQVQGSGSGSGSCIGSGSGSGRGSRSGAAARAARSAPARAALCLCSPPQLNLLLRKVYHLAAAALMLHGSLHLLLPEPAAPLAGAGAGSAGAGRAGAGTAGGFLGLCLAVAAQVLLLLELARALRVQPAALSRALQLCMTKHTDERDSGVFLLTHLYLLMGLGVPLWMASASSASHQPALLLLQQLSGVLSLGLGDACAAAAGISAQALLGSAVPWRGLAERCCRRRGGGSSSSSSSRAGVVKGGGGKSLVGSAAFACSVLLAGSCTLWLWLQRSSAQQPERGSSAEGLWLLALCSLSASGLLGSALEVLSGDVDNLVVPVFAWAAGVAAVQAARLLLQLQ
jgi:hypothetical protein